MPPTPVAYAQPNRPQVSPQPPAEPVGWSVDEVAPRTAELLMKPTTQAGWMIGLGSLAGAASMLLPWTASQSGLAHPVNWLLFVALLGVAATEFLAYQLVEPAQRMVAVVAIVLVGLGMGLEGMDPGGPISTSVGLGLGVFILSMLAASAGVVSHTMAPSVKLTRKLPSAHTRSSGGDAGPGAWWTES
jgi:hypothetical protein